MINTQVPSGIIINIIIVVVIIIVMMIWASMMIKIAYSSKWCWHKRDTRERLLTMAPDCSESRAKCEALKNFYM